MALYRERFQPSTRLDRPHVIAGVNVIAADSDDAARQQLERTSRGRVRNLFSRHDRPMTDEEVELVLRSPQAAYVDQMLTFVAVGTPGAVRDYLDDFARHADADDLMVVHQADPIATRLRSVELLAEAAGLPPA